MKLVERILAFVRKHRGYVAEVEKVAETVAKDIPAK